METKKKGVRFSPQSGGAYVDINEVIEGELARIHKYPDMTDKFKAMELRADHQRLQSAVLEAVKEERRLERLTDEGSNTTVRTDALLATYSATKAKRIAVDALIAFEAEHKIGVDHETS